MQPTHADHAHDSRLRIVFDDAVLSFDLAANATFADIALALGDVVSQHDGVPIAIDVTFAVASASHCSSPVGPMGARLAN
jgi:hypothetical protein